MRVQPTGAHFNQILARRAGEFSVALGSRLPDAKDVLGLFAGHGARVPGGRPNQVNLDVAGPGPAGADPVYLALQHRPDGAARAGECHLDLDVVLVDVDVVDQAEVDEVQPDLGVDDRFESLADLLRVDRFTGGRGLVVGTQVLGGCLWVGGLRFGRLCLYGLCLAHAIPPTV